LRGLSIVKAHLPLWSKAEGRSGIAVRCSALLGGSIYSMTI